MSIRDVRSSVSTSTAPVLAVMRSLRAGPPGETTRARAVRVRAEARYEARVREFVEDMRSMSSTQSDRCIPTTESWERSREVARQKRLDAQVRSGSPQTRLTPLDLMSDAPAFSGLLGYTLLVSIGICVGFIFEPELTTGVLAGFSIPLAAIWFSLFVMARGQAKGLLSEHRTAISERKSPALANWTVTAGMAECSLMLRGTPEELRKFSAHTDVVVAAVSAAERAEVLLGDYDTARTEASRTRIAEEVYDLSARVNMMCETEEERVEERRAAVRQQTGQSGVAHEVRALTLGD